MRFRKRGSKSKKYFLYIAFIIFIIFFSLGIFFVQAKVFSISQVNINAEKTPCVNNGEFQKNLAISGKSFFWEDLEKSVDSLKQKYPCVKKIVFSKSFPNKVNVELLERQPFAKITNLKKEATSSALLLAEATASANIIDSGFITDDEGVIFNKDNNLDLLEVYLVGKISGISQIITNPKISDVKEMVTIVNGYGIAVKRLYVLADQSLFFDTTPKIFFNPHVDLKYQLASLQLILNEAKISEKEIEFIDLRFDKPIVKFAPKKKK